MKYTRIVHVALAGILAIPGAAWASKIDALIADLTGKDEALQARARQLLPREGVEAVPKLVPLVEREDQQVWRAAFNTLMDFATTVSVPGRESDRVEVTRELMTLIGPEKPVVIKLRGLRLLPLVVPAGYDVTPMTALLADAEPLVAERARAALQETGTAEAAAGLRAFLPKAKPEFQCALLDSLGAMKDAGSLKAIDELTRSADGHVRVAAARALAWTGDPFKLKVVKAVLAAADDGTRAEAADALIRLVNAIEEKGGNWEISVANYKEILGNPARVVKEAGLAGLGRLGDGTCVEPVLAAIAQAEAPTWQVGVDALRRMQGVDVANALVELYPKQPERLRPALLGALASKRHAAIMPILTEAAKSSDAAMRVAAWNALRDSELPQAVPVLAEACKRDDKAERDVAHGDLKALAAALQARGMNQEAGQAYVAVMDSLSDDESRRAALEDIITCPAPEALAALMKLADNKALAGATARALVATAGSLTAAKRKPEAVEALELAQKVDGSPEMRKLVAAGMRAAGAAGEWAASMGLLTDWSVVGPFELGEQKVGWEKAYIGEPDVALNGKYMAGKTRIGWDKLKGPEESGVFDLQKALGAGDNLIAYVYTEAIVEKDTDAILLVGSDDSARVWVNGQKVFEAFVSRGITPDQDKIPIKLKAGKNAILMKIWQDVGGWTFCARLTTPDGQPMKVGK